MLTDSLRYLHEILKRIKKIIRIHCTANFPMSDTTLSMSDVLFHFTHATVNHYFHFSGKS